MNRKDTYKPYSNAHARQIVALVGQFDLSDDKETEQCIAMVNHSLTDVKLDFFDTVIEPIFQKYSVDNIEWRFLPTDQQAKATGAGNVIGDVYDVVYPQEI